MAIQSVIEIDVLDEKFKAFQKEFEKYKKSTKESTKEWKEVNTFIGKALNQQKEFNKSLKDGVKQLKEAAALTSVIAGDMAGIAISAAKWVAYSVIGGYTAMGALAYRANAVTKESSALGITRAQLRSARVYGNPYYDNMEGMMGNIQDLQTSLGGRWKIDRLLGGDSSKNPYENLVPIFDKVREAKATSGGFVDVAMGQNPAFQNVLTKQEMLAIWNMSEQRYKAFKGGLNKGAGQFPKEEENSQKWTNFWIAITKTGQLLESKLINVLGKLTEPLAQLTEAVADALVAFLGSKEVEDAIKGFVSELKDPDNKQALKDFFEGIFIIGKAIAYVISKIPNFAKWVADYTKTEAGKGQDIVDFFKKAGVANGNWYDQYKKDAPNNDINLGKVDPELVNTAQRLGLTVNSGYRTQQEAILKKIWHPGSHHTVLNKEGFSTALDIDMDQALALRAKFKTEEEFTKATNLWRPYLGMKGEENHFELKNHHLKFVDPNPGKDNVFIYDNDGTCTKLVAMK